MNIKRFSKKIALMWAVSIALQPAIVAQQSAWQRFKGSASESLGSMKDKLLQTLDSASVKFKSMNKEALFNAIQKSMDSSGKRVRRVINCIASGSECSTTDRILLVSSATFICGGLLFLAGTALTAAARSEIIESAQTEATKETKGWSPQAIALKLSNSFNSGKQKFMSLKQGIIAGKLTRDQQKFLRQLGAGIIGTTLVLAAVLTGLAVYSKNQDAKRDNLLQKDPNDIVSAEQEEDDTVSAQDESLESLASDVVLDSAEPQPSAFTQLFDSIVSVDETGNNIFQRSYHNVKKHLIEKTISAKEALSAKTQEAKQKLKEKAQKALDSAKKSANELIKTVTSSGSQLIKNSLQHIFNINYDTMQSSYKSFNESLEKLFTSLNALFASKEYDKLMRGITDWFAVQQKGFTLYENLSQFLTEWVGRKKAREGWRGLVGYGTAPTEESKEKRSELMKQYPLAFKMDFLLDIYNKFYTQMKLVDLRELGNLGKHMLDQTGTMLHEVADMYNAGGVFGKIIIPNVLVKPLSSIEIKIRDLGGKIKAIADKNPLSALLNELPSRIEETPLKEWFTNALWYPSNTIGTAKNLINNILPKITETTNNLFKSIDQSQKLSNTLMTHGFNMLTFIKQNITESLEQKPFQNYIKTIKLAVVKEAQISKELINDTLLHTTGIIFYLSKLFDDVLQTLQAANTILGTRLLSQDEIRLMQDAIADMKGIVDELSQIRTLAKQAINV